MLSLPTSTTRPPLRLAPPWSSTSGADESESGKLSEDKFPKTGRTYGKAIPAFNEDPVLRAAKRDLTTSEEPEWSVARKTQRLCAGAGL